LSYSYSHSLEKHAIWRTISSPSHYEKLINPINESSNSTSFSSFLYFPVKYLKEVTPYFRKASLLAELGWDLQKEYMPAGEGTSYHHVHGHGLANGNGDGGDVAAAGSLLGPLPGPPPDSSYSRSDTRCVPLTLSLLATNFKHQDPGKTAPRTLTAFWSCVIYALFRQV
jgi:hypothetical protein